jgi:ubiquinone/menaquinone biosynthesis C-methylase UbiE
MRAVHFYQPTIVTITHFNTSSATALYTDLSGYYDLMCKHINYLSQSNCVRRLHQFFGNDGRQYIDLACGTGPHIRHFVDFGYHSSGLDINQPMLEIAQQRCPEAQFILGNMSEFTVAEPVDLISCFLYSLHYCADLQKLQDCITSVHKALKPEGVFCFNAVDKNTIDNQLCEKYHVVHDDSQFEFTSAWHYPGQGDHQALVLNIEKSTAQVKQMWQDHHPMVAISFAQLQALLSPYFEVHMFEHDYDKIIPWKQTTGNAIFACVKK